MKRLMFAMIVICLILLAACNEANGQTLPSTQSSTPTDIVRVGRNRFYTDPSQVPFKVGRLVTIDAGTYTLTKSIWLGSSTVGMQYVGRHDSAGNPTVTLIWNGTQGSPITIKQDAHNVSFTDLVMYSPDDSRISHDVFGFCLNNNTHHIRFNNVRSRLMGLAILYGADDITFNNTDTGITRGYGIFTGGVLNERLTFVNDRGAGSWDLHTRRFHQTSGLRGTNCTYYWTATPQSIKQNWNGEGLKLVDGKDAVFTDCDFGKAPRLVVGPLLIESDKLRTFVGATFKNCKLPYLNLYSGASRLLFDTCTVKGGECKPSSWGRPIAEATFKSCSLDKRLTGSVGSTVYINSRIAGVYNP